MGLLEDPEHEHAALGVVSVADGVMVFSIVFSFGFVSTDTFSAEKFGVALLTNCSPSNVVMRLCHGAIRMIQFRNRP